MVSRTRKASATALPPGIGAFPFAPMTEAIRKLYRIGVDINAFVDKHIDQLKSNSNQTIASTGRVLEAAKYGFGIGYASGVAIIAVGQLLLGNPLGAAQTVLAGATLTNPIAMTCAAIGAIYYGWNALSDKQRDEILDRLSKGLQMGVELIRSLVNFVIKMTQQFLTPEQLSGLKSFMKTQATRFGKSLYDVTGMVGDLVTGTVGAVGEFAKSTYGRAGALIGEAVDATTPVLKGAYVSVSEGVASATSAAKDAAGRAGEVASEAARATRDAAKDAMNSRSLPFPVMTTVPWEPAPRKLPTKKAATQKVVSKKSPAKKVAAKMPVATKAIRSKA